MSKKKRKKVVQKCITCMFFDIDFIDSESDRQSWCERYPPVYVGPPVDGLFEETNDADLWQQPTVGIGGTCGEWKGRKGE